MPEELIAAAAVMGRFVVAFALVAAAIPKLLERHEFEQAVRNYALLPSSLVSSFARWLPRLEFVCGLMLLFGVAVMPAALAAGALLALFATAIAVNLVRGREIDCGCSGAISARRIGWSLVAADLALAGMALLAGLVGTGVLALLKIGPSGTALGNADGLALLVLGGVLVVGFTSVAAWHRLQMSTRSLRRQLEVAP